MSTLYVPPSIAGLVGLSCSLCITRIVLFMVLNYEKFALVSYTSIYVIKATTWTSNYLCLSMKKKKKRKGVKTALF